MKIILNLVEVPLSQKRLRQVWQHWREVGKVVDASTRPEICRNLSFAAVPSASTANLLTSDHAHGNAQGIMR